MANQRKYFKHGIAQLEAIFENSRGDIGTLEELEEELGHRKTQRAQKLFARVQSTLNAKNEESKSLASENSGSNTPQNSVSPPKPSAPVSGIARPKSKQQIDDEIDWVSVLDNVPNDFPPHEELVYEPATNDPLDILESWTAIEAFSPQTYKRPQDLQGGGSVAYFKDGEPWFRDEKSRPKCNLYYVIYIGEIKLEKATENLISIYQDNRVERPATHGKATLGVILVNKHGIPVPETGIALSSFGWAYGQVLSGHLNQIKNWEIAEKILLEKLDKLIYCQDKDGQDIPLSITQIQQIYRWLVRVCKIPENDVVEPSFVVRLYQAFSKGEPETPLLNSFYLSDLQRASSAVQSGTNNYALSQYLGNTKFPKKIDVLHNKSYLEDALQPKYTPLGRWPSRGRFPLVLLQQAAVNLANRELKEKGLFSVNGPPGTGKTTLLRDIVAHNVVERAIALSVFEDVNDAFSHVGQIKLGRGFIHLYKLSDTIRGFEMLVASSNNKAVENISKELPLNSQIADDLAGFSYFNTVSDALSDDNETTWGMIAAVLGNAKNRGNFANKVWWDEQSGLQTYFKAIAGQMSRDPSDYKDNTVPPVIEECNAPADPNEAVQRWSAMRNKFRPALAKAREVNALAQKAYESQHLIRSYEKNVSTIKSKIREQTSRVTQHRQNLGQAKEEHTLTESALNHARQNVEVFNNSRPGFVSRLFLRAKWRLWCQQYKKLQMVSSVKGQAFDDALSQYHQTDEANKLAVSKLYSSRSRNPIT